jgi:hypothetical protein
MHDQDIQTPVNDLPHLRKSTEVFIEFQWKFFVQTFDALSKGLSFYFLIVAATTGLTFQAKLQGGELKAVVAVIVTITALVTCAFLVLAYALVRAISRLGASLRRLNEDIFVELGMASYFRKIRIMALIITCLCLLVLVVISLATVSLLYR